MKTLFCTFLSIFAFSSIANATSENCDSEANKAFNSSTSTTLSDPTALQIPQEEEKFEKGKRKREETTTITRPIPDQTVFDTIATTEGTMLNDSCPPTPIVGYYEFTKRNGKRVYWEKEYDPNGKFIGFV